METKAGLMEVKFDSTLLIARVAMGVVVLAHGVQKLFGWFGGYGFDGTMQFFTGTIGLPYIAGLAIIVIETFGMLALIAGLFSRVFAFAAILIMFGAISFHSPNGFYMNWGNTSRGEGYEFHLLVVVLALVTVVNGGGRYSVDRVLENSRLLKKTVVN